MKDSPRGNSSIVTTPRVFVQFSLFLSTQPRKLSKEIAVYFIFYIFARYVRTCVCVPVFFLARLKKCRLPDTIVDRLPSSVRLKFPLLKTRVNSTLIRPCSATRSTVCSSSIRSSWIALHNIKENKERRKEREWQNVAGRALTSPLESVFSRKRDEREKNERVVSGRCERDARVIRGFRNAASFSFFGSIA